MSPPLPDQDEDACDPPAPTPSISSADGRPSSSETLIRLTAVHAPRGCLNTQIFNPHFRAQGTAYLMASTGHSLLASVGHGYPAVPAKRKRGGERVRVTRACDRCKKRKIKCNGEQPCDYCKRVKVSCTFDAAYSRGRRPSTSLPLAAGGSNSITVGNGIPDAGAHAARVCHTSVTSPDYHAGPNSGFGGDAPSSQSSPEPAQTDLQGHYVGPTSGVSFLLRVQKRVHQAISFSDDGNIFTFGDAPLQVPTFDPSFCMMLPRDDAQHLVDRYFDFAMPTYRFLHRPTVQEWFDEFYDTLGIMRDTQNAPAKIALLFTVFALARVYMPENDRPGPPDLSTRYFLAADQQLTRERGSIRLTSVQVRLTQCCYLLTQSRINHCWSLFGTVSRLALALGLNRSRRADAASGSGIVESESRRRTFWCAYTLDAYLSVTLGRPRSFHDDDIDVEYPACVDDHELTADLVSTASSHKGFSTMLAPLAHIKLARIIGRIVRDLYSIKPISSSRRSLLTERVSKDLSDWRVELSRFLDADFSKAPLCIPLYQRQRNVLNFTYWHAIILTYRPFLLSNFARSSRRNSGGSASSENIDTEECVRQCLGAAMNTVKTIDEISETQKMYRAFWITAYFAFTATIVLYIYVIQKRASPPEVYSAYFAAATQCQSRISVMAEKGSLPERYCLVLEELRIEALRQARRMNPSLAALDGTDHSSVLGGFATVATSMPMNGGGDANNVGNYADLLGDGTSIDFNNIPSSTMSDSPDWGHFASMVSSGLGNLDLFLEDDGFRF